MKSLVTIKNVEIVRKFQHTDGTFSNVYGITLESGEDTICAESFVSQESQKKIGLKIGAIGTASIEFAVRYWQDKEGKNHPTTDIRLKRFDLANRNIGQQSAQNESDEQSTQQEAETPSNEAVEVAKDNSDFPF